MLVFIFLFIIISLCFVSSRFYGSFSKTDLMQRLERQADIAPSVLQEGRDYYATKTMIFCGLVRNGAHHVKAIKDQITSLGSYFQDYRVIVVENDSTDNSRELLLDWHQLDPRVTILGCGENAAECRLDLLATVGHWHDEKRIRKMTQLRNIYLDHITNTPDLCRMDLVCMMDLDLDGLISHEGWLHSAALLASQSSVNAVGTNSLIKIGYYWVHHDPYAFQPYGRPLNKVEKLVSALVHLEYSSLFEPAALPFPVVSCFGGLMVYRNSSLRERRYVYMNNELNGTAFCEHEVLNRQISGIYNNPKMLMLVENNP